MSKETGGRNSPSARRARAVRIACGFLTQKAWADHIGVSTQRWNNVEIGLPISKTVADAVRRQCPSITTDYLFNGNTDGLPLGLARQLGTLEEANGKATTADS